MDTFGKRVAGLRKEKKLSQGDVARMLKTSISVVGRYERDEMNPSVEVARKIASLLDTTVGYLLGESEDANLFKDTSMLKRLRDLSALSEEDKKAILYALDGLLRDAKARKAYVN